MGNLMTKIMKYGSEYMKTNNLTIKYIPNIPNIPNMPNMPNISNLNRGFRFGYNQHYTLYIYFNDLEDQVVELYKKNIEKQNQQNYFKYTDGSINYTFDSGFDLYSPVTITTTPNSKTKIDYKISCCMKMGARYVGYYLYPRSSTGSKTPLRMANSVGIIDSGYRGNLQVYLDNISQEDFTITQGERYVQICPPNLDYPIYVVVVDKIEDLGLTNRGSNGFGSTGK